MTDVLVIGAGPTGLTAAAEAVRHGLTVRIVDANAQRSIHSKALVLHSRSLEVFTDTFFVGLSDHRPSTTLHEIQAWVAQRYAGVINCYVVTTASLPAAEWAGPVIVNPNGALHRHYGAIAEALYLIRPDQHIGYRSQPVQLDLFRAYVEGILLPTA